MIVLFEDNHLLALDKPAGLLTQQSGINEISLESLAREWLKIRDQKKGNVYLHAVHRLDRSAAGIVLFAKSSKALKRLQQDLKALDWHKEYLTLVEGVTESSALLRHFLLHLDYRAQVVKSGTKGSKEAILSFEKIKECKGRSILRIHLETGRYHQIRAQLSAIGHPIVGDKKYGAPSIWSIWDGIALIHSQLTLVHPVTKNLLVIDSKIHFLDKV